VTLFVLEPVLIEVAIVSFLDFLLLTILFAELSCKPGRSAVTF
jgi:hypothetical protein